MAPRSLFGTLFFLVVFISAPVLAGGPTEQIRETSDKIIAIVSDPDLKAPARAEEKKQMIRQAVDERFDWEEMCRRALGRHWAKRTQEEKKEFRDLFAKLLERTYLEKVEGYSGEEVLYEGEDIDGRYAVVKVKIISQKKTEIPVHYKAIKNGNQWLVYDIFVNGVSLINNYRAQFNSIIVRSSYEDLINKLKIKVSED